MAKVKSLPQLHPRLYRIWNGMKQRCNDKNCNIWKYYGGKNISYCEKWNTFAGFVEDMLPTYRDDLTLERSDSNVNYSKENCSWATMKTQANNTSRNRRITIEGVTKTLSQWIDLCGLKSSTVRQRFYVLGWDIEKSLYHPLGKRG